MEPKVEPEPQKPEPLPTLKPEIAARPAAAEESAPEIKPMEPKGLDAPEGAPDDLTQIEGVLPEHQAALNKDGIYHFAQFVSMNRRELAWLDQNLPGMDGSAGAESWRKQAIALSRQT